MIFRKQLMAKVRVSSHKTENAGRGPSGDAGGEIRCLPEVGDVDEENIAICSAKTMSYVAC